MPRIAYENKRFGADTLDAIHTANQILEEYEAQGYDLTLRQLFYQHVARGLIQNTERSYKRLGSIVNDARLSGYIDWDHIVDRTRNMREVTHWRDPAHIIGATARSFKVDLWENQPNYVEVWIEKDALVGVIQRICTELDVPYFSCRGYTSQSEMWSASQRILDKVLDGKKVTVLHLGDHDPSGIDMSRDIQDRLRLFIASDYTRQRAEEEGVDLDNREDEHRARLEVGRFVRDHFKEVYNDLLTINRIALTMAQVRQYNPPPNPAKVTDSRAKGYIQRFGHESWELDALDPPVMTQLIRDHIEELIEDPGAWNASIDRQKHGEAQLQLCSQEWQQIVEGYLTLDDPNQEEDDE